MYVYEHASYVVRGFASAVFDGSPAGPGSGPREHPAVERARRASPPELAQASDLGETAAQDPTDLLLTG